MQKILLTGGLGYIGSNLAYLLLETGYSVTCFDNFINPIRKKQQYEIIRQLRDSHKDRFIFNEVDLSVDSDFLKALFKTQKTKFDAVINLASLKSVPESVEFPAKYYKNNVNLGINLTEAMQDSDISVLINSSSCSVYGDNSNSPISESTPLSIPTSPYANTKLINEQIFNASTLNVVNLRYFNPVGAIKFSDTDSTSTSLFQNICRALKTDTTFKIYGEDYNLLPTSK